MRPPQRGATPLLPTHGQLTHGHALKGRNKQRRGALVSRLILITVVIATVAYGGFAWLYLGKSSTRHTPGAAGADSTAQPHAATARSLKEKGHRAGQQHHRSASHPPVHAQQQRLQRQQQHRHEVQTLQQQAERQGLKGAARKRGAALHEASEDLHQVVWHGAGGKAEDTKEQQLAADLQHQVDIKQQDLLHKAADAKAPETDSDGSKSSGAGHQGDGGHLEADKVRHVRHEQQQQEQHHTEEAEQVHHARQAQQTAGGTEGGEAEQVVHHRTTTTTTTTTTATHDSQSEDAAAAHQSHHTGSVAGGTGGGGGGGSRVSGDVAAEETEQVHHEPTSLFQLSAKTIDGEDQPLSKYKGKVTLVVNVASACGYTDDNYKGLMKLYQKYQSHGLEILAFPCNQFGSQEPKPEAEIKEFCSTKYHVTFPMFAKVHVNGPLTHPVFKFLKSHTPVDQGGGGGEGPGQDLGWNFFKFVVDHKGRPVKRFNQLWNQVEVEQAVYSLLMAQHGADAGNVASR